VRLLEEIRYRSVLAGGPPSAKGGPGSGHYDHKSETAKPVQSIKQPRLSAPEDNAVFTYVLGEDGDNGNFVSVNRTLREGKAPKADVDDIKNAIKSLDSAIAKGVTVSDLTLWRGVFDATDYKPGDVIQDKAFQSTTSDKSVAGDFAGTSYYGPGRDAKSATVLQILLPKGSKALDMAQYAKHAKQDPELLEGIPDEHEVLLPRSITYKVTGPAYKEGGMRYLPVTATQFSKNAAT
jgi:hypothetical protein